MAIKLYESQGCECFWEEIGNQVQGSTVKGYTKVGTPCAKCQADAIAGQANMEKRKAEQEANQLIAEKQRSMAVDALTIEGKLSDKGEVIKLDS
jgi:hypothetical protein